MRLDPGTRLGPYTIAAPIGAGGMGEVYRATDFNLGRDVAIKVLPEEFAEDFERLARFEREARTLASLSHPNIAIVHGLERADGLRALVMELIDGPTLADRIEHGPIPVDEALPIARQIAEALEAAHEHGVIHRDLKPANIKVRPDGTVKVLDFGLAKIMEPTGAMSPGVPASPTITSPVMTRAGVILGTASYMSPEQVRGRSADRRSDVWALGCVLYEMLTGRRPFDGDNVSDVLASVLRSEPDWNALPRGLPPVVVKLIKQSLEKDRRRRIGDVAAALFVLAEPFSGPEAGRTAASFARHRFATVAAGLAALIGVAATGWWVGMRSAPVESAAVTRFVVPLRSDEQFTGLARKLLAVSPNGRYLAYIADGRLVVRPMDRLEPITIRGTERSRMGPGAVSTPFFSPDSRWIGFWQDGQIKKVSIEGGPIVTVAPAKPPSSDGFSWEDDGTILFVDGSTVLRVSEQGGQPDIIIANLKGRPNSLQVLPDKRSAAPRPVPTSPGRSPRSVTQARAAGERAASDISVAASAARAS